MPRGGGRAAAVAARRTCIWLGSFGLVAAIACAGWAPLSAAATAASGGALRSGAGALATSLRIAGRAGRDARAATSATGDARAPRTHLAAIVAVANSQVGDSDPYAYGPAGSTWCAYFTSWVWRRAGVAIPETGPAADIGTWALAHGGTILGPSARPAPGDAVLWVQPGTPDVWPDLAALAYPNIEHVNIVTQVLPDGEIVTVGGNESGAVRRTGPFSPAGASSYFGQAIYGFVRPPA